MQAGEVTVIWSWDGFRVHDSGHGQGVIQFHVGFHGHVGVHGNADPGHSISSVAVAVVLGAAELGWFGQHDEHLRLGFHFRTRSSPKLHFVEEDM